MADKTTDKPQVTTDKPQVEVTTRETVIAPGGPRPRESAIPVKPGEAVRGEGAAASVVSGQNFKPDGTIATGTDLVLTPGGFRPSSQVFFIENGNILDGTQNSYRKLDPTGKELQTFGLIPPRQTGKPLMPQNVMLQPATVPALGSGWICYASFTENTKPVSLFTTSWVVPAAPASQDSQIIFLFNGIQNDTMIYQPVLQYGVSAAGGGPYWAVASWYADGQGGPAFYSSLVRVSVGQALTGIMTETSSSASGFSYNCQFTGIANTSLPIRNVQQLTWCVETLECYGLQKCSDYPNTCRTAMQDIQIQAGGSNITPAWGATNAVTDCGQHCVVVSDASPGGEVDLFYTNSNAYTFNSKVILPDTSPVSPALASLNGVLFLAWKGDGNNNLNVECSTDNGLHFGGKFTSGETSPEPPCLCAHNGALYIGWKGNGNDNLNVARVNVSGGTVTGFSNKVTLPDTSPLSPSLASVNGNLYLAWKGDGNNNLNVEYSSNNGASFGNKYTSPETSAQAPALCAQGTELFIAWKGSGNDNLNVARVNVSGSSITGLVNKVILPDTSPVSPTLASLNNVLYLGWKGDGNDFLNIESSSNNGASFGNKYTSFETSPQAPGLCAFNGRIYVTWKGDGNDNLNVAAICGT